VTPMFIGRQRVSGGHTLKGFSIKCSPPSSCCTFPCTMTCPSPEVLASRRTQVEQCDVLMDIALASGAQGNATAVLVNYHVPELQADSD
jgi:hypothetical protein